MKEFDCAGRVLIEEVVSASSGRDAASRFELNFGGLPETVGTRKVVGRCNQTQTVILEGDEYQTPADGIYFLTKPVDGLGEDAEVFKEDDIAQAEATPD